MFDLHIHSNNSDGTDSVEDIFRMASENNVSHISITDHFNLDTYLYNDVYSLSKKYGVKITPGVEVDCLSMGRYTHVIGYGMDVYNEKLKELIDNIFQDSIEVDCETISLMQRDNIDVSVSEFERYTYDRTNGGWKFIKNIYEKDLSDNLMDGIKYYKQYTSNNKKTRYEIGEVCDVIHNAGGAAVYAHPAFLLDDNSDGIIEHMKYAIKCGIDGIECYHPSISDEVSEVLVEFCKCNQLYITSGSDYHGSFLAESKKSIGAQKHGEIRFIE